MNIGIYSLEKNVIVKIAYILRLTITLRKIGAFISLWIKILTLYITLQCIIRRIIRLCQCICSYHAYRHLWIGCVQIFISFVIIMVLSQTIKCHIMTSFSNQNNASAFPLITSKLYFVTKLVIGQSAAFM